MSKDHFAVAAIPETSEELLARLEHKEWYLPALQKMGDHRKREWLAVRVLLKEITGEEKRILYTGGGKPYLEDRSYYISISHTKNYVAVCLHTDHPVAIDIEQISPRAEKIRSRFMSETEEKKLSAVNPLVHTLLHWSAKETLFKYLDENDIEFKSQLHIDAFEPVTGAWDTFTATETRTGECRVFEIRYLVDKEYVVTMIE
jgi:phosphopantetheinyl transferase